MTPGEAAALAAIRAAYAVTVTYTGAGLDGAEIRAIRSDGAAPSFQGAGNTAREISFEIERGLLPEKPRKKNLIVDASGTWSANDITERDDIDAWIITVERP